MEKIHEKSPCCGGSVWRFGERRRRCSVCKKTWRSWQKNKGPKKLRKNHRMLFSYLENEIGTITKQKNKSKLTPAALHARMAKSLKSFNEETPWPCVPKGELIAITDAMIEYIEGIPYVVYFILLRPLTSNKAIIMPFFVTKGSGEGYAGWQGAFNQVPAETRACIRALVCDGIMALFRIARDEGWVLQRCQFHLLARIEHNASTGRFGKNRKRGRRLIKLANIILFTKNEAVLQEAIQEIKRILIDINSRSFRTVLFGFIKHHQDFRSYLNYPKYNLPTTSNSAEHMISRIRKLQFRAHGFRTIKSLSSWIEGYIKFTKIITCNPKIHTPT